MSYNSKGFRSSSRALRITWQGRFYEYCVTGHGKIAVFARLASVCHSNAPKAAPARE